MKGHRISTRKGAALHATDGCYWSTRPILGALVDLDGAAAERCCKLPGCRRQFAEARRVAELAEIDAAQRDNDGRAWSKVRRDAENRLADARVALLPADVRAQHDDLAARIRATMARSGAYLPQAA